MFDNKYPYTDFHEMNLDFVLKTVNDLDTKVNDIMGSKLDAAIDKYYNSIFINAIYDEISETITLKKEIIAGDGIHVYSASNNTMTIE